MDENQKFQKLVNRGIEEYFKRNPRIAVKFGKEEYEKVVESGTKEHIEDNLKWFRHWIDEIKELNCEKLNFENQISLKAMEYNHNINRFMHEAFPLWKKDPNGFAYFQEIAYLLFQRKGPTKDVAEALIVHLTNLPNYLKDFQSRFDETPIPLVWRDLALEQIQTTPKFLHILAETYSKTSEVAESLKDTLLKAIKEINLVIPHHIEWIKSLPVDNDEFAWALGPEKFDKLLSLRKLPWDRNTLMKKGTKLFNSGFKQMKRILKERYPTKTLNEGIEEFFKEDLIPTFENVLEYTRSEAERAKEFVENHDLATVPQEKLVIIETPLHLIPIIALAAYDGPPYFNREQPGIFMISPTQKERHSYTSISYWMTHEAYPGHHLDFTCNNTYAPLIRLLGLEMSPSYETIEGWALYCEELMLKEGFHNDPIKTQQLLSGMQLQEAMEIILDIQLHCKQRSIADASKMLMNILQMGEGAAKAAVVGWTTTPGYQLSYLVGKLLIEDLRREVEEKMGNNFNLKFFHDTILKSGDLPYFLLKEYFEEKMKKRRCRAIKDFVSSFPDPLILNKGDNLRVEEKQSEWPGWIWATTESGKSGWVPINYLKIEGNKAVLLNEYNATELTVLKGQEFTIEKEESGWAWVSSETGERGWIPLENVKIFKLFL